MKTSTKNTNCTLLAIGIWYGLGCASTSAYEYLDYEDKFPQEHLGARHFLFSGTHTILDHLAAGLFFHLGTSELTLSVPDLGLDDVTLFLTHESINPWELYPTNRGRMEYKLEGTQAGVITFAGKDLEVEDPENQTRYTYQMAGYFTGGPLAGASLLAIGRIEETRDDSDVWTRTSTVEGVLIVPFYTDFPPFRDMESLPPLKPVTDLPSGIGWRICEVEENTRGAGSWGVVGEYVHVLRDSILSCPGLGLRDLWLPHLSLGYQPIPAGYRHGTAAFLPSNGIQEFPKLPPANENETVDTKDLSCGETAWQGMRGQSDTPEKDLYVYHDYAGVFWSGPMAGCLYLSSTSNRAGSGDGIDHVSTVLLIPDETDHGVRGPQILQNVSERGRVGTGEDVLITGFVVSGDTPRTVLVRAIGPGLEQFGVTDRLENPVLNVFRSADPEAIPVGSNDNWEDSINSQLTAEYSQKAGAFALEDGSNDAAILFSWLEPGAYTVHVSGADGTSGVALAEVYQIGD